MFAFTLSAYRSNSGKTVITSGILRALSAKGLCIAPFKCGPDYIDTRWLEKSSGNSAYNLDTVLMKREECRNIFEKSLSGKDGGVIEGVMGLFDGLSPVDFHGSTYDVAKTTGVPVILIIDSKGLAASIAAIATGVKAMAKGVEIAGVIFNKISGARHENILKTSLETHVPDLPILGAIPNISELAVGSRHLGIEDAGEELYQAAAAAMAKYVDLDRLVRLTARAPSPVSSQIYPQPSKKVYVAYDNAFHFYYTATFDLLRSLGYEIYKFSPLKNEPVENADLILLGGGYPEIYADILADSGITIQSIKEHHNKSKPIFAECGGFLYLCKNLYIDGTPYPMTGIFDISCEMTASRQRLGYVYNSAMDMNGHAFHYSRILECNEPAYGEITRLSTGEKSYDGYLKKSTCAGYTHFMPGADSKKFIDLIGG